jgi:hypothetical protein
VLLGCAQACKSRIFRRLSLLRIAQCCTVLRSRWYQSGINRGVVPSAFTILLTRARTRSTSSTSPGTPRSSLPSTATLAGCRPWAGTLPTGWTKRWVRRPTLALRYSQHRSEQAVDEGAVDDDVYLVGPIAQNGNAQRERHDGKGELPPSVTDKSPLAKVTR